jgi:hypothetical protein
MEFVCYPDLEQLPEGADVLFAKGEKSSIFFSRSWFENLVATAGNDVQDVLFACVVEKDKVLAILPVMNCTGNTWHSLRHRYTSLYTILLAENDQQQILKCLIQGLRSLPIDGLLLEPVAENDPDINSLQRGMEASGFSCSRSFRFYNWALKVQGQSYHEYMDARPSRLRNTIARKKRKLEREQGYEVRLFSGDEVPQYMSDYHAVYKASWKANEQYMGLLDGMVAEFSKHGWSRLAILYIKGQPAAAQLWYILNSKASIFRLAYDENWKKYSPGSILTSYLMEYVIDTEQVDEIDFLTGNEAYKQDWMPERRERCVLSCVKNDRPSDKYGLFTKTLKRILNR